MPSTERLISFFEMPQEMVDAVGADPGAFAEAMGQGMEAFQGAMADGGDMGAAFQAMGDVMGPMMQEMGVSPEAFDAAGDAVGAAVALCQTCIAPLIIKFL